MSISVNYKVLAEGYRIRGGREQPLRATVSYLVSWADAFTFYNEVLGQTSATVPSVGSIVRTPGHQLEASPNLYAETGDIEPCGASGGPITGTFKGLKPGEFFTHAKVTVEYSALTYSTGSESNPMNQLDPDNPITYCEQEIDMKARFDTEKASGWVFSGGSTNVPGPFARKQVEAHLVLTFPRVPFLPWKLIKPYAGCVNSSIILGCEVGTLLLEGMRIKQNETNQGLAGTSTQLMFSQQDHDWNKIRNTAGVLTLVVNAADSSKYVYAYKDFRDIFV